MGILIRILLLGLAWGAGSLRPAPDNRFALLIGIGTYPKQTGVEPLNTANDLHLMQQTLRLQGFPTAHVLTLAEQHATRRSIEHSLDSLARALPTGSRVVVLFSGHCLQIKDDNGDETDGLDEALLPYDGRVGQPATLLRDDRLGMYLTQLRARVGPMGHVLFLFDSCHSGSLLRQDAAQNRVSRGVAGDGAPGLPVPGTSGWFETQPPIKANLGQYALLAATADGQPSFECTDTDGRPYGPLTLAVCRVWRRSAGGTYQSFFEQVRRQMEQLAPYQLPTLEGNRQARFLGG